MKTAITFIVLAAFTLQSYGQDVTVPVRTATFKHNRAMYQCYSILLGAISYAKKSGGSAADIGTFMGDLFKDGWKKEGGYKGFMRGTVGNFESFRREKDPAIEILEQNENKISFKWKINYKDMFVKGPQYGVSYEELTQLFSSVHVVLAEHHGATYSQEVVEDDWLKITITKK